MNTRMLYIITIVILLFVSTSCTVQNRLYRPGLSYSWSNDQNEKGIPINNSSLNFGKSEIQSVILSDPAVLSNIPALVGDVHLFKQEKSDLKSKKNFSKVTTSPISQTGDSCDQIVLKNGDEILALVREINQTEIKYKRCDTPGGPMIIINKSDVLFIKYANGAKEIFKSEEQPVVTNTSKPADTKKIHTGGVISFVLSVIGAFVAGIPLGLTAIILAIASITKIDSNPDKFRGKGWGIAGLIIGAIDVIAVIIILSGG